MLTKPECEKHTNRNHKMYTKLTVLDFFQDVMKNTWNILCITINIYKQST